SILLSVSAACYSSSHYDKWTDLTYEDLVALLDSGDIQLFDVREPKELEETGKIPRSVNIPLGQLADVLSLSPEEFKNRFGVDKPKEDDQNIVFHCRTGVRSKNALLIARELGLPKARHYVGGFEEWASKQKQRK
ncbi:thiosulfate sulfurtransferase/rhodanese-like domain-containing protein 3, partial [Liolophura sinensis]|uniref:thiosulfate sulfurtransferase/rhodanese-like domain-containing protein 3 n=1 Tax=Liolophura sinensis TaxID=3198878 RepID=UPI0031590FDA